MKVSVCQLFAVVLTLGLLFTSAIAPILPFAHAHTEYETIPTQEEIMETTTTTTTIPIYETHKRWSDSAGKYIDVQVQVGTTTTTTTEQVRTGQYTTETVTKQKEHTHWFSNPKVIVVGITFLGVVAGFLLGGE